MRKLVVILPFLVIVCLGAAACGSAPADVSAPAVTVSAAKCVKSAHLMSPGTLTIGTDNPAYSPYFTGGPGHGWKGKYNNDPSTGKGFEAAVGYAVAKELGFTNAQVTWQVTHFSQSFTPGPKNFDLYLAQVSYKPVRAQAVDFSTSYYDVNQALVALKGSAISRATTIAGLKGYKLGAQIGTTGYDYVTQTIKPSQQPSVYNSTNDAISALKDHQIDGIVVDFPTAYYIADVQLSNGDLVGQFPTPPGGEHFGFVLAKGSALTGCVDKALATLRSNDTLAAIQKKWLAEVVGAPVLK